MGWGSFLCRFIWVFVFGFLWVLLLETFPEKTGAIHPGHILFVHARTTPGCLCPLGHACTAPRCSCDFWHVHATLGVRAGLLGDLFLEQCWTWHRQKDRNPVRKRRTPALWYCTHRLTLTSFRGPLLPGAHSVLHKECAQPPSHTHWMNTKTIVFFFFLCVIFSEEFTSLTAAGLVTWEYSTLAWTPYSYSIHYSVTSVMIRVYS